MRFTTRQIYRAFPELDQFEDARCAAFIAAAQAGVFRKLAFTFTAFTLALFGLFLPFLLASLLDTYVLTPYATPLPRRQARDPIDAGLLCLGIALALFFPLLLRDFLLRRRLRYILRIRGTCPNCGYNLIGLFIDPQSFVTCAECGTKTIVDPSLKQLHLLPSHFGSTPQITPITKPHLLIDPKTLAFLQRALIISVIAFLALLCLGLAGNELFIRLQARRATALLAAAPHPSAFTIPLQSFIITPPPSTPPTQRTALDLWTLLQDFQLASQTIFTSKIRSTGAFAAGNNNFYLQEFPGLLQTPSSRNPLAAARAHDLLVLLEKEGLFRLLDALPNATSALPAPVPGHSSFLAFPNDSLSTMFAGNAAALNLARLIAAEQKVAASSPNSPHLSPSLANAVASNFAIANALYARPGPGSLNFLTAARIELATHAQVLRLLRHSNFTSLPTLLAPTYASRLPIEPLNACWDGFQRFDSLQIADAFASPNHVRFGAFSSAPGSTFQTALSWFRNPPSLPHSLGTLSSNLDLLQSTIAAAKAAYAIPPAQRPPLSLASQSKGMLLFNATAYLDIVLSASDVIKLQRARITTLIALERYHQAHAAYPPTLEALTPDFLAAVPLDPITNASFIYAPLPFTFYSMGLDNLDNKADFGFPTPPHIFTVYAPLTLSPRTDIDLRATEP